MLDEIITKELTKNQLQVAKTTHAMCYLLDATRKLTEGARFTILKAAEADLLKHLLVAENHARVKKKRGSKKVEALMKAIFNV